MKASRVLSAAALLACAVPRAGAAAARASRPTRAHPTCSEGQAATLTGHPFLPWRCLAPGEDLDPASAPPAASTASVQAPPAPVKAKPDKARSSPKDLTGRWEGLLIYGPERLEILWEVRAAKGGYSLSFAMKDYHSHAKQIYQAELRPGKGPGVYDAVVEFPPYADRLKAKFRFAPAPSPSALDRLVELTYDGRPVVHRVRLTRDGKDRIRFSYEDPALDGRAVEGELTRTERQAL